MISTSVPAHSPPVISDGGIRITPGLITLNSKQHSALIALPNPVLASFLSNGFNSHSLSLHHNAYSLSPSLPAPNKSSSVIATIWSVSLPHLALRSFFSNHFLVSSVEQLVLIQYILLPLLSSLELLNKS